MEFYINEKTDSSVASTPIVDHASYAPELHTPQDSDKERFVQIKGTRFWEPTSRPPMSTASTISHDQAAQKPRSRPRTTTIVLSILLLLSVLISVGVGGAVGITTTQTLQAEITQLRAQLAARQSANISTAVTTPSSSSNSSTCTLSSLNIASTCDNSLYQVKSTCDIYQRYCDSNFASILTYQWMFNTTAPDLRTCIEICDTYNYRLRSRDMSTQDNMTAVVWGSALSNDTQIYYPGSCFCAHADKNSNLTVQAGIQMAMRLDWNRDTC